MKKNRFLSRQKREHTLLWELLLPTLIFLVIIALLAWGIRDIDSTANTEKLRAARQAVTRAAVQCYAVEGRYPPNLSYMIERYGLSGDIRERYTVHYVCVADNLIPEIAVLPHGSGADETEGVWG